MLMTISDSTTGSYSGVSSLAISGIPVTITPDEICVLPTPCPSS